MRVNPAQVRASRFSHTRKRCKRGRFESNACNRNDRVGLHGRSPQRDIYLRFAGADGLGITDGETTDCSGFAGLGGVGIELGAAVDPGEGSKPACGDVLAPPAAAGSGTGSLASGRSLRASVA